MTLKSSFPSEAPALQIDLPVFHVCVVSLPCRCAAESLASGEKGRGMLLTIMHCYASAMRICD